MNKQSWDYYQYYTLLDNGEICADNYLDNELAKEYGVGTKCFRCGHPLLQSDVRGYHSVCLHCDENFYSFEEVKDVE